MNLRATDLWTYVSDATEEEIIALSTLLTVGEKDGETGEMVYTYFLDRPEQQEPRFLTGLLPKVTLPHQLEDLRTPMDMGYASFDAKDLLTDYDEKTREHKEFNLRDYQATAIRKSLTLKRGLLDLPTRSGKTEVFSGIVKERQLRNAGRAVIVVPDKALLHQASSRLIRRGIDNVGKVGDGYADYEADVVVGIIDSLHNLAKKEEFAPWFASVKTVIIDEVHHLKAASYKMLSLCFSEADLVVGVSGTPFENRDNPYTAPSDCAIIGYLHRTLMRVTTDFLVRKGYVAEPNVFFFKYEIEKKHHFFVTNWMKVYNDYILANDPRNTLAANIATWVASQGFTLLVSVVRIEHGLKMLEKIGKQVPNTIFASAKTGAWSWYTEEFYQLLRERGISVKIVTHNKTKYIAYDADYDYEEAFGRGDFSILIGSSIFDEGRDLPTLDGVILLGGGGKSEVKNIQRPARALTISATTRRVFIIDFVDSVHPFLKKHSKLRRESYLRNDYRVYDDGRPAFINFIQSLVTERQQFQQ